MKQMYNKHLYNEGAPRPNLASLTTAATRDPHFDNRRDFPNAYP